MPTYEYRCKACSHQLEVVQAFTDDALTRCPSCGAEELRKVFGSVGIAFKGSGFYKNDSRRGSSSSVAASSSTSSSGSDGKGGSDSKGSTDGKDSTDGKGSGGSSSSSDSSAGTPSTTSSDAKSA